MDVRILVVRLVVAFVVSLKEIVDGEIDVQVLVEQKAELKQFNGGKNLEGKELTVRWSSRMMTFRDFD